MKQISSKSLTRKRASQGERVTNILHEIDSENVRSNVSEPMDTVFAEGELVTRRHQARERSPRTRKLVLARRALPISCDACGTLAEHVPEPVREAVFEVHHLKPLHMSGSTKVRTTDCAVLCATCHRAVHALIRSSGDWLDLAGMREQLSSKDQ